MKRLWNCTLLIVLMTFTLSSCGSSGNSTPTTLPLDELKGVYETERGVALNKFANWMPNDTHSIDRGFLLKTDVANIFFESQFNSDLKEGDSWFAVQTARDICSNFKYDELLASANPTSAKSAQWMNSAWGGGESAAYLTANTSTIFFGVPPEASRNLLRKASDSVFVFGEDCSTTLQQGLKGTDSSCYVPAINGWEQESDTSRCNRLGKDSVKVQSRIVEASIEGFPDSFYIPQASVKERVVLFRTVLIIPVPALNAVLLNELFIARNGPTSSSSWASEMKRVAEASATISNGIAEKWSQKVRQDSGKALVTYEQINRMETP